MNDSPGPDTGPTEGPEGEPAEHRDPQRVLARRESRQRASAKRASGMALSVVGELLVTAGVLVFLFLGWQLWLNDLIVGEQHREEAAELAEAWDGGNAPIHEQPALPIDHGAPIVSAKVADAQQFAIMYVPRFGSDYQRTVWEGVSESKVLDTKGIGRYPETQLPGEVGNFAIAAHRTTYGKPFSDIGELRVGDRIIIRTQDAYYTYVFRNMEYVWPSDVDVLNPLPRVSDAIEVTDRILTMTSCNPRYSRAERIIAYSVLESWQPAEAGPPAEIAHLVSSEG